MIDTKIQYLVFTLNHSIASEGIDVELSSSLSDLISAQYISDSFATTSKNTNSPTQKLLEEIEYVSRKINRLLKLRSSLCTHNLELIYNLVISNYYMEFSSEELALIVRGKREER